MRLGEHVIFREVDATGVLIDVDTGFYYSLNETGVFILECVRKERRFDEILADVVDRFHVDPKEAREHLRGFLEALKAEEIVIT